LRPALSAQGLPDSTTLNSLPHGRRAHFAGLVICRQRPGTASGVTFMTLEDEAGFVNVVVWRKVYEQFRVLLKTSAFIGVSGKLQVEQGVVHLIAERLWTPRLEQQAPAARSRDFH
jgi:error-prone DNA polymerase